MARFEDICIFEFIPTETLYEMLDALFEDINDTIFNKVEFTLKESTMIKEQQLRSSGKICAYLSELYRRNLLESTVKWYELDPYRCNKCKRPIDTDESLYTFKNKPERSGYIRCYECIKIEENFKIYNSEECEKIYKNDRINKLWDILFEIKEVVKKDYAVMKKIRHVMTENIRDALTIELTNKLESLDKSIASLFKDQDIFMMEIPEQVNLLNYITMIQLNQLNE